MSIGHDWWKGKYQFTKAETLACGCRLGYCVNDMSNSHGDPVIDMCPMHRSAPDLLAACESGGVGYSANVLLWNAAGCLKEMGERHSLSNLIDMANELREKAEIEWKAIAKARGQG
jgi:hypothetical protein